MKNKKQLWKCNKGHGAFITRADQPKCPVCKTVSCSFLSDNIPEDLKIIKLKQENEIN